MVLAIACTTSHFTLLDSNGKKTRFLTQAAIELGLRNVSVVQARVEEFRPDRPYDCALSRAFSSLEDFVSVADNFLTMDGRLLAMKARNWEEEMRAAVAGWHFEMHPLFVPNLSAPRCVIIGRRCVTT